jgi:hypothetical protein
MQNLLLRNFFRVMQLTFSYTVIMKHRLYDHNNSSFKYTYRRLFITGTVLRIAAMSYVLNLLLSKLCLVLVTLILCKLFLVQEKLLL